MKNKEEFYEAFLPPEWKSIPSGTVRRLKRDMAEQISQRIFFKDMTESLLAERSELSLAELRRLFRGDTKGFSLARLSFHSRRFQENSPKPEPIWVPKELGQVIASREFEVSGQGRIKVQFGLPLVDPKGGFYKCPYEISGIGERPLRWGPGVDSVQAIYMAMVLAEMDLRNSEEGIAGRIFWPDSEDENNFGFPALPKVKRLPFSERYKKFKQAQKRKK